MDSSTWTGASIGPMRDIVAEGRKQEGGTEKSWLSLKAPFGKEPR